MNIEHLFSTKERIVLINSIIFKNESFGVNIISKKTGLSKGLVSKYLTFLEQKTVLKRFGLKYKVQQNIRTKAIKILLNLSLFDASFFRKYKFIKSAGVYGSFVKGTNSEDSDIDLWVYICKTSEENLAKLTNGLKTRFGNIAPIYLTKEKIDLLKRKDPLFYHALVFGSITVYGDDLEQV